MKPEVAPHPPAVYYRSSLAAIISIVVAGTFLIVAVTLLVSCAPIAFGCLYPFTGAGLLFLFLAVVLGGFGVYQVGRALSWTTPSRPAAPASNLPRHPDSPVPTSGTGRLVRSLQPRSWIDDVPESPPKDHPPKGESATGLGESGLGR